MRRSGRRSGMHRLLVGFVLVGLVAACQVVAPTLALPIPPTGSTTSVPSQTGPTPTAPPSSASGLTLLTWVGPIGITSEALVLGPTTINDSGCVELDGRVLVAPPGSSIDSSGTRLHIESVGDFNLGDHIQASGGYPTASELGPTSPTGPDMCSNGEFVIVGGPRG